MLQFVQNKNLKTGMNIHVQRLYIHVTVFINLERGYHLIISL